MRPTYTSIAIVALLSLVSIGTQAKKPVELTDKNFEHDTQASTGATTGDWFISFCDWDHDEAHKCEQADTIWEQLSESLNRRVSVAQVDL